MAVDVFSKSERLFYLVATVISVGYGLYRFHGESERYVKTHAATDDFVSGWSWLGGRKQDVSDSEWNKFTSKVWILLPCQAVHVLLCLAAHRLRIPGQMRTFGIFVFDAAVISYFIGIKSVTLLVVESLLFYVVASVSCTLNRSLPVWILFIVMTLSMNSDSLNYLKIKYLFASSENMHGQFYEFMVAQAFGYLSLCSFAMDTFWHVSRTSEVSKSTEEKNPSVDKSGERSLVLSSKPSFIDLLYFMFCLPKFFDGPIYNYQEFHEQQTSFYDSPSIKVPIKSIIKSVGQIGCWYMFIEFQSHFFYHCSMGRYMAFVTSMPLVAAFTMLFWQGTFFQVKYVVLYGLPMEVLRFEGITPHSRPRCISLVYSFNDMWRYFDVGLYKFMKKYIFVPCGGSRSGVLQKAFASAVCFIFIYVWHGGMDALFYWCLGNYIVGLLETVGIMVERSGPGQRIVSTLGLAMWIRVKALLWVPIWTASSMQICFFFFGVRVGKYMTDRVMINPSWSEMWTMTFIFYCGIQNAMAWTRLQTHKKTK